MASLHEMEVWRFLRLPVILLLHSPIRVYRFMSVSIKREETINLEPESLREDNSLDTH